MRDLKKNKQSKSNQWNILIAFAFFLQLTFTSQAYARDAVTVGVVNVTYLMEAAPQSEIASVQLKKKFSPQEKKLAIDLDQINALELELNEMKVAKKDIELQRQKERVLRSRKRSRTRSLQDFREELRFARDVALDEVQKEVFRAIDEVRIQQKIDIVLQDYVSASKRVDITPLVLKYLKDRLKKSPEKNKPAN